MRHITYALILLSLTPAARGQEILPSAATRFANRDTRAVPDFQKHVVPLLGRLGCNSAKCHGSFQGQGGFRLSLFGFDFQADHQALTAKTLDAMRVNMSEPRASLIVLKPTRQTDHEGGRRFAPNAWEHHLLLRWIESGARGVKPGPAAAQPQPDEPDANTAEGVALFKQSILPLLENHCYECHGTGDIKGKLRLTTRAALLAGGRSGPAIVPGKPDLSLLIAAVRHTSDDLQMPPSGKLEQNKIAMLEKWVRMGAPWPNRARRSPGDTHQVLRQLHCEPAEILFHKAGDVSQIKVIAEWENGEREDVTCLTRFQTNNDAIVSVNRDGLTTSLAAGDTHVVAFYDNGVAAIPVLRPYGPRATHAQAATDSPQHPIDRLVNAKLSKLAIQPSALCTDAEFLRRASIDLTGTLPTPDQVESFLADTDRKKRIRKIDELLTRSTYAAWWANKLCDFTGCNPKSISSLLEVAREDGYVKASIWYDWIYERVANNTPYDQLVAGIMLADPSRDDAGMPYFWTRQSLKQPQDTAVSVAHAFLGIQLQCAECHKHPFDQWTQADFQQFSQFFTAITASKRRSTNHPQQKLSLLRSRMIELESGDDPRIPIMDWMRDPRNPWFARAFVNRVWAGYFHVGIVDPPDQFTPANPPSNPQLLDWLTNGFINNGYDMKWLHRQIVSSHTYQRSWKPNASNRNDRRNFSRAIPRRIPAEVVYDAMKQATCSNDQHVAVRTNLKRRASGHLSMRMAGTHAMKVFGKPDRTINCDCERVNEPTLLQAIFTQNDPLVRMRLADSGWIQQITAAEQAGKPVDQGALIRQVWLRTVNRPPSAGDMSRARKHIKSVDSIAEGISDLMWAMLNTKEFLLNH